MFLIKKGIWKSAFFVKRNILMHCLSVVFERFVTVASFLLQKMERLGVELLACLDWVCSYWGSQPNHDIPSTVTVRSRITQIHLQKGNFTSTNSTEESARIHGSEAKLLNICLHSRWGTKFCFEMLNANKLLQVTFYCFVIISFKPCPQKITL